MAVVDRGARSLDGHGWRLLLRPGIAPATGTVSTWETILVICSILAPLRASDLRMKKWHQKVRFEGELTSCLRVCFFGILVGAGIEETWILAEIQNSGYAAFFALGIFSTTTG